MPRGRQAIHILARFHGSVVEDHVVPAQGRRLRIGHEVLGALPPRPGSPDYGRLLWQGPQRCLYIDEVGERHELSEEPLHLGEGAVRLELRLVPQFLHARTIGGDFIMVATVGAMVLVAWLFIKLLPDPGANSAAFAPEPTPELIARLLEEDYAGEKEGFLYEQQERPDSPAVIDSFYLPAGDKGPLDSIGGAEQVADEKTLEQDAEEAEERMQPLPPSPPRLVADSADAKTRELPEIEGVEEPEQDGMELLGEPDEVAHAAESADTKKGWGFKDHDGAVDQRDDFSIRYEIRLAKALLEIDPDDPWALQQMAYYQYLAEDLDAAEQTYERYIELYPESPAGYNNLALVYKRRGQYEVEEGYYRLALAYEPGDASALNNLAVNLAHQQRYDEALRIMDRLTVLTPEDPYSDLHRAKIHSAMGSNDKALFFLEKALEGVARLDTLHTIEFRQDIRVDPAFDPLREEPRFEEILVHYYGEHGREIAGGPHG